MQVNGTTQTLRNAWVQVEEAQAKSGPDGNKGVADANANFVHLLDTVDTSDVNFDYVFTGAQTTQGDATALNEALENTPNLKDFLARIGGSEDLAALLIQFAAMSKEAALDQRLAARDQARADLEGAAQKMREGAIVQIVTATVTLAVSIASFAMSVPDLKSAGKELKSSLNSLKEMGGDAASAQSSTGAAGQWQQATAQGTPGNPGGVSIGGHRTPSDTPAPPSSTTVDRGSDIRIGSHRESSDTAQPDAAGGTGWQQTQRSDGAQRSDIEIGSARAQDSAPNATGPQKTDAANTPAAKEAADEAAPATLSDEDRLKASIAENQALMSQLRNQMIDSATKLVEASGGFAGTLLSAEGKDLEARAQYEQSNADMAKKIMDDLEEMIRAAISHVKEMQRAETELMANMTRV